LGLQKCEKTEPLSATDRPIAVFGVEEPIPLGLVARAVQTSLSPETAIRNGFDIFVGELDMARRQARGLIRLAEEAGVRIGVSRWLRRAIEMEGQPRIVTLVANPLFRIGNLVDLCMWLTGTRGILRVEAEAAGDSQALALRGHSGTMMNIHLTPGIPDLRVFVDGHDEAATISWPPAEGLGSLSELLLFASHAEGVVSLEDSMPVISVLEQASARTR
jgi:hypothetical protein